MSYFDDIYEVAADNYGLVTTADAAAMGIRGNELVRMAERGLLVRRGYGVYRLARYIPTAYDPYAEAVALVGPGGYLFGESVVALLGLAPTDPRWIWVATPRRVRRNLPGSVRVVRVGGGYAPTLYEGIPSQEIRDALFACVGKMSRDKLLPAVRESVRRGLLTAGQEAELEGMIGRG